MADSSNGDGSGQVVVKPPWEERPFDPGERASIRKMLKEWEWYNTVLGLIRRLSTWSLGVAGAIWAGKEVIGKVLKALVQ